MTHRTKRSETPSEWGFTVTQEGQVVAEGEGPDEADARREAMHYAIMYAQDGPEVTVEIIPPKEKTF